MGNRQVGSDDSKVGVRGVVKTFSLFAWNGFFGIDTGQGILTKNGSVPANEGELGRVNEHSGVIIDGNTNMEYFTSVIHIG